MKVSTILNAALVLCLLAGVSACTKRDESMGPAQKAGQAVDNAGHTAGREAGLRREVGHAQLAAGGAGEAHEHLEVDHAEEWLEPLRQVCATPDGRSALRALLKQRRSQNGRRL